jgi:hypothetical protein
MSGKKITELGNKTGLINNHKTVIADSNGVAHQTDYLGATTGSTWNGINTATFERNDGNSYNLEINSFSAQTISGGTFYSTQAQFSNTNQNALIPKLLLWSTVFDGNNANTSTSLPNNTFVVIGSGSGGVSLPYRPPGNTVVYITNASGNSGFLYGNSFNESVILNGSWNSTISSMTIVDGIKIKLTFITTNFNTNAGVWFPEVFTYFTPQ